MSGSEILFHLVQPSNALFLLTALGLCAALAGLRGGLVLALASVLAVLLTAVFPVGKQLSRIVEARAIADPLPDAPAGIVVLGGFLSPKLSAATGQMALTDAAERLTAGVALANRYPAIPVIITDGAPTGIRSGAEVAAEAMADMGIDPARIVIEPRARSTWDNAVFSKALVQPGSGEAYILVTSALHMPRAFATFRVAGWTTLVAYPVDRTVDPRGPWLRRGTFQVSEGLEALDHAAREFMALAVYRLRGRTDAFIPRAGPPPQ